jgi:hypothetical protein
MGVKFDLLHSRMMNSKNRVFRRIFGLEREDEMNDWRNLFNEEPNHFYFSPNIFRIISTGLAKHAALMREIGSSY